jgi:hypothetical protein
MQLIIQILGLIYAQITHSVNMTFLHSQRPTVDRLFSDVEIVALDGQTGDINTIWGNIFPSKDGKYTVVISASSAFQYNGKWIGQDSTAHVTVKDGVVISTRIIGIPRVVKNEIEAAQTRAINTSNQYTDSVATTTLNTSKTYTNEEIAKLKLLADLGIKNNRRTVFLKNADGVTPTSLPSIDSYKDADGTNALLDGATIIEVEATDVNGIMYEGDVTLTVTNLAGQVVSVVASTEDKLTFEVKTDAQGNRTMLYRGKMDNRLKEGLDKKVDKVEFAAALQAQYNYINQNIVFPLVGTQTPNTQQQGTAGNV